MADASDDVAIEFESRRGRVVLSTVVLGSAVAMSTATVVNVALPSWPGASTPGSAGRSGSSTATCSPWRRSSSSAGHSATATAAVVLLDAVPVERAGSGDEAEEKAVWRHGCPIDGELTSVSRDRTPFA